MKKSNVISIQRHRHRKQAELLKEIAGLLPEEELNDFKKSLGIDTEETLSAEHNSSHSKAERIATISLSDQFEQCSRQIKQYIKFIISVGDFLLYLSEEADLNDLNDILKKTNERLIFLCDFYQSSSSSKINLKQIKQQLLSFGCEKDFASSLRAISFLEENNKSEELISKLYNIFLLELIAPVASELNSWKEYYDQDAVKVVLSDNKLPEISHHCCREVLEFYADLIYILNFTAFCLSVEHKYYLVADLIPVLNGYQKIFEKMQALCSAKSTQDHKSFLSAFDKIFDEMDFLLDEAMRIDKANEFSGLEVVDPLSQINLNMIIDFDFDFDLGLD